MGPGSKACYDGEYYSRPTTQINGEIELFMETVTESTVDLFPNIRAVTKAKSSELLILHLMIKFASMVTC